MDRLNSLMLMFYGLPVCRLKIKCILCYLYLMTGEAVRCSTNAPHPLLSSSSIHITLIYTKVDYLHRVEISDLYKYFYFHKLNNYIGFSNTTVGVRV